MNIQVVQEHSVDLSLINKDSKVLDLGFRAGSFSTGMLDYVSQVYAIDADSEVVVTDPRINLLNVAVGHENGRQPFIKYGNGTGNYLSDGTEMRPREHKMEFVEVWTLDRIQAYFEVEWWDLIKFDVEGAEYEILHDMKEPISNQITFEMHEHTHKRKGALYTTDLLDNLQNIGYELSVIYYSEQHGSGFNYWDVLAILKPEYRKNK